MYRSSCDRGKLLEEQVELAEESSIEETKCCFEEAPPTEIIPARRLVHEGANSPFTWPTRSLTLVRAARLQLFKMSPMAVTGSIFNRAEISAGGTAGKEPE